MDHSDDSIRLILDSPPPPKTWNCPGLADGVYETTDTVLRKLEKPTDFPATWSILMKFNANITNPEHLGTYDVTNGVGVLREGTA